MYSGASLTVHSSPPEFSLPIVPLVWSITTFKYDSGTGTTDREGLFPGEIGQWAISNTKAWATAIDRGQPDPQFTKIVKPIEQLATY